MKTMCTPLISWSLQCLTEILANVIYFCFTHEEIQCCSLPLPSSFSHTASKWPRQAGNGSWLTLGCQSPADSLTSTDALSGRWCLQTECQGMGPCCSLSPGQGSSQLAPFCFALQPQPQVFLSHPPSPPSSPGFPKCSDRLITRNSGGDLAENPAGDLDDWASGFSDVPRPPAGSQQIKDFPFPSISSSLAPGG